MYFAFDRNVALYGYTQRFEGFYTVLYYMSVLLLSTFVSEKYKKVVVHFILICGAFQACYAICQLYEVGNVRVYRHTYKHFDEETKRVIRNTRIWALGVTTNPNIFGANMLLCLSYSMGLFLDNKKIIKKIVYVLLIALFAFGILISNSLACVVGVACVGLYVLVYCIKNKYIKSIFVIIAIIVAMTLLAVKLDKTKLIRDVNRTGNQVSEITKGNSDDSYGTNRMFIWKETVNYIPKYFLHGIGIDNFYFIKNGRPLVYKTMAFDKAHNEYLQILITEGIFALVSYFWLYGFAVISGMIKSFKKREVYLILPVIGYLAQAFFSYSAIEVAPIFFIALGLCCAKEKVRNNQNKERSA